MFSEKKSIEHIAKWDWFFFSLHFSVGFALLPFIWAVNSIWFFDEAFRKPAYDEQKSIRRCMCILVDIIFFYLSLILSKRRLFWINQMKRIETIAARFRFSANAYKNVSKIKYKNVAKLVVVYFSDVIFSAIGAIIWAIGLAVWITIYQSNRVAWGEFADTISFIIPLGKA